jgi:hypothetical protein
MGWAMRVRIPAEQDFDLRHNAFKSPDRLLSTPKLYGMGTRVVCSGAKRLAREANHSLPSSVEVKNAWSYNTTLPSL